MRVVVLGGTRFVGRAVVADLLGARHDVLVVHRGENESPDLPIAEHAHVDRRDQDALRNVLASFRGEAIIDTFASTRADAETLSAALPSDVRLVVLSSIDVYRAYSAVVAAYSSGQVGTATDAVPLDESAPLRTERYPFRGTLLSSLSYEKLDVEAIYLARGATVCRLPLVYGEHDYQRREEFILRRVRAGRRRIPIGAANWLCSRGYVGDIATGIRLALEADAALGEVLNLGEAHTASIGLWARHILEAAASDAELVRVPDFALPDDLRMTAAIAQHFLVDASKARSLLNWNPKDPMASVRRSVQWHLDNPPLRPELDFQADERALAAPLQ